MSTTKKPRRPKSTYRYVFDIFKAKDGWRWRLWARNGRMIAVSGEAKAQGCGHQAVREPAGLHPQSTMFL